MNLQIRLSIRGVVAALLLVSGGLLIHLRDYVEGSVPYRVVAELPVIRQLLSLPGLRILRPESEQVPAAGPATA